MGERVSEEPKPVQAGIDSSHGPMEMDEGSDSERRQVERKRVEKNYVSGVQAGIDSSHGPMEMDEGLDSERRLVKRKRVGKNHVSGLQSGVDASDGQLGGGLETCQVKRKRVNKMVQSRVDASHGQLGGGLETHQVKRRRVINISDLELLLRSHGRTFVTVDLKYAKIALDFYEKRQDAKFEILEVLFSNRATLVVPGFEGVGPWCHVSFIAKPKNSDCCGKRFFGEMVWDRASEKYNVTYCTIFEPSDPGNVAGCVFCPGSEIFLHPPDGCPAGGREIDKFMVQNGTDASQGQVRGCSKRHRQYYGQHQMNSDAREMIRKARRTIDLKYVMIAMNFYEKSKDAKFEIVETFQPICRPVVVPGSNSIEEWCHVSFIARPKNGDRTKKYFFAELLRDATTGKYSATYCEIFEPSDQKVAHNCIMCPKHGVHPLEGYRVGRPPCSLEEEDLQLDLNLGIL